jgi:hypothetical protein
MAGENEGKRRLARKAAAMVVALGIAGVVLAQAKSNKYVGVDKCKNCHSSAAIGNQYGIWKQEKHPHAFENLASDKAKEIGAKQGIPDPQTSDKCLKCHTTGFSAPKDQLDAKFDPKLGVQCEACHGPGGNHVKARMAAAASGSSDMFGTGKAAIPAGEINAKPDAKTCTGCHNKESPTFTSFDFPSMYKQIAHPIPKK